MYYYLFLLLICQNISLIENKEFGEKIKAKNEPWENLRLPKSTIPVHYDMYLFPDYDTEVTVGKLNIVLETTEDKTSLHLHVKDLNIALSKIYQGAVPLGAEDTAEEVKIEEQFIYDQHDFYVARFTGALPADTYTWHFEFTGKGGWTQYTNGEGETR